ncbi:MAG: ABC transporter ATP-binding protein, partial [Clostridiales bacterium]|nr:ABC transporter ATP-binding protein [Clostridiales bacterium]
SINPILAFAVIVVFIPHIINNILRAKVFTDLADQAAPLRRKYEYYEKCISDREYFKETRILGGFQYFHSLYQKALKTLNKRLWDAEVRCDLVELFMYILTLIAYIGVLYLLVISMFQERVSVGEFAAVFTALSTAMALANNIMNGQVKQISGRIPSVTNFLNFLNLPERGGEDTNICAGDGVVLKDVVFRYPLSENNAIDGINLTIKKGETVAVVGENGSGKSTLVKLIMGLYVPDEGNVTMEGKNTRELKPQNIYAGISVVFQQFQKYKLTLLENISISKPDTPVLEEEVRSAAQKADVYSESDSYPQGYDTILSNEFDGVDLSGGQWQRVAIARGFYRNQSMILLDEPTAAIDPVEETRLYHKFAELSKDKTAIIVTHRLGSAKIADRIIVMDAGKMIGEGTHESLMLQCEKYSKMYDSQAKNYSKA